MRSIIHLNRRGMLTEKQFNAAVAFRRNPELYEIEPTFYTILYDIIVLEVLIEAYEKRRGWSARSAKTIVRVILQGIVERNQTIETPRPCRAENDFTDKEMVEYLTAPAADSDVLYAMHSLGLTRMQARVFTMLKRAPNQTITRDNLLDRMYFDDVDSAPDSRVIDVHVCNLRKKLAGTVYDVDTVFGFGFKLNSPQTLDV